MKEFTIKVINTKSVPWAVTSNEVALGWTDEAGKFHGAFFVPDVILRKKGDNYTWTGPSKPYIKDGAPVLDENHKPRYLDFFKLYMEKGANPEDPSKYAVTSDAWDARKELLGLLIEAARAIGLVDGAATTGPKKATKAKPAAAPARPARPATAKVAVDEDEIESPTGDDDDLPF